MADKFIKHVDAPIFMLGGLEHPGKLNVGDLVYALEERTDGTLYVRFIAADDMPFLSEVFQSGVLDKRGTIKVIGFGRIWDTNKEDDDDEYADVDVVWQKFKDMI